MNILLRIIKIKVMDKELTHTLTETNMLENGKNINIMGKALTYILTVINTLENGKTEEEME